MEHLRGLESEIAALTRQIEEYKPLDLTATTETVRRFAFENVRNLRGTLRNEDIPAARTILQRHVEKLVLTPTLKEGQKVFEVSGNINLMPQTEKVVMEMVARDGLEPPTPAFSGLRSTNSIWLILRRLVFFSLVPKAVILDASAIGTPIITAR